MKPKKTQKKKTWKEEDSVAIEFHEFDLVTKNKRSKDENKHKERKKT
jgi:hypothetical protein